MRAEDQKKKCSDWLSPSFLEHSKMSLLLIHVNDMFPPVIQAVPEYKGVGTSACRKFKHQYGFPVLRIRSPTVLVKDRSHGILAGNQRPVPIHFILIVTAQFGAFCRVADRIAVLETDEIGNKRTGVLAIFHDH